MLPSGKRTPSAGTCRLVLHIVDCRVYERELGRDGVLGWSDKDTGEDGRLPVCLVLAKHRLGLKRHTVRRRFRARAARVGAIRIAGDTIVASV